MTQPTVSTSSQWKISEVLKQPGPGRVLFSVEFMPPRDDAAENRLYRAAEAFHDLGVAFVSVTYGAGGSTRERTRRIARRLAQQPLTTLVHVTLVNHTQQELLEILKGYGHSGLCNLLVLRGDPPGNPLGPWKKTNGGLNYALELIDVINGSELRADFDIGIASFPEGHYRSPSLESDTRYTLEKLRAGAQYSITQMFFGVEHFLRLRDRLVAADRVHGSKPVIPGLMPITSERSLGRILEFSGASLPAELSRRFRRACVGEEKTKQDRIRKLGLEVTTEMAERLIAEGVEDLHFMTLNYPRATQEVLHNLGMAPAWGSSAGHDAVR